MDGKTTRKSILTLGFITTFFLSSFSLYADGGMWMLPLLKEQNYERMQSLGLKLSPEEIYSPDLSNPSLSQAVVLFDGGCTGEVVSDRGLVFTNHHCGYDAIQNHSSLEHNYLRDGFVAPTLADELPNPGMDVIFTEEVIDVTDFVARYTRAHGDTDPMKTLSKDYLSAVAKAWYTEERGEETKGLRLDLLPFFEGNKFYLFIRRVYEDIRLVAAPQSAIGKFGADTDNWTWPRHSGDFSVFRIYTAPDGSPAKYAKDNVPLKPKKYFKVDLRGIKKNDFVMIMGHPGTTRHFYTAPEVELFRDTDNAVIIEMREIREREMLALMKADEKVNIQYAAKYASSENAHKRSVGSNWAIAKKDFVGQKQAEMNRLKEWALKNGKSEYIAAMDKITALVEEMAPYKYAYNLVNEGLKRGVEITGIPLLTKEELLKAQTDPTFPEKWLSEKYDRFFNKDYNAAVDLKVSKAMIRAFKDRDKSSGIFDLITDTDRYTELLFARTLYRDRALLKSALQKGLTYEAYTQDPAVQLALSVRTALEETKKPLDHYTSILRDLKQIYVKGLMNLYGEETMWPDANLTLRYTFGQVKGYSPRDDVYYGSFTSAAGVLEKYIPGNYEYDLPEIVREKLAPGPWQKGYTMPDGRLPVDFIATTHTTGGNSGSPVINGEGHLVGLNFDRNWEGVGGDIIYLPDYQRSIICDVRYVVFVLDQILGADRIVSELDLLR